MNRDEGLAIRDGLFRDLGLLKGAMAWGNLLADDPEIYAAVHGAEIAPGIHLRNPGPDAAAMTEKYARNTANAQPDYVKGMQNPRRDPKQAALAAAGKFKNRMQQVLAENRWEAGVRGYDVQEAVATATSDGGAAYTAGIQKRTAKISRVFARLAPRLGAISQAIQQLPQDTDAAREQRMLQNLRMMRALGQQLRGGGGVV